MPISNTELQAVITGIENYLAENNPQLTRYTSYGSTGKKRAQFYLDQLKSHKNSLLYKEMLLDALLMSKDGKTLQDYVGSSLLVQNSSYDLVKSKIHNHHGERIHVVKMLQEERHALLENNARLHEKIIHHMNKEGALTSDLQKELEQFESKITTQPVEILPLRVGSIMSRTTLSTLMSSHLPNRYEVNNVKVTSYNVTLPGYVGFTDFHEPINARESEQEIALRFQNIGRYINHSCINDDFIALQEVDINNIKSYGFDEEKTTCIMQDGTGPIAILYDRNKWEPTIRGTSALREKIVYKLQGEEVPQEIIDSIQIQEFRNLETNDEQLLINAKLPENINPDELRKAMTAIQSLNAYYGTAIFVGDFNLSMHSTDIKAINQANSVVPIQKRTVKNYAYTEGCFVLGRDNIQQVAGNTLDTKFPGELLQRPLVDLRTACTDNNYEPILAPMQHRIRMIADAENPSKDGSISTDSFLERLKLVSGADAIELKYMDANGHGVKRLAIQFHSHDALNMNIDYLDAMNIKKTENGYHIHITPHTSECDPMQNTDKIPQPLLNTMEIIAPDNTLTHLPLPSLLALNIVTQFKELNASPQVDPTSWFGHPHDGLLKITAICQQQPLWTNASNQKWDNIVNECKKRTSGIQNIISHSFFNPHQRDSRVDLIYRSIAHVEENIKFNERISTLKQLLIAQQKRDAVEILENNLVRLQEEDEHNRKTGKVDDNLTFKLEANTTLINDLKTSSMNENLETFLMTALGKDIGPIGVDQETKTIEAALKIRRHGSGKSTSQIALENVLKIPEISPSDIDTELQVPKPQGLKPKHRKHKEI